MKEWRPTPRETSQFTRRFVGWCRWCDAAIVGDGDKCPSCGKRRHLKLASNPPPTQEEKE